LCEGGLDPLGAVSSASHPSSRVQVGWPDAAACTERWHRRPCRRGRPKAPRKSGRKHTCIAADDPRICPPGCIRHAAACPDRQDGGLVFREAKEWRRKTVALPPELVAVLKAHREAQDLEQETAANLWADHDVVFAREDGRPIDPSADLRDWSAILAQAGIPPRGHPHDAALGRHYRPGRGRRACRRPGDARPFRYTCHPRLYPCVVTAGPGRGCSGRGGLCSEKLLRKTMIHKAGRGFPLVRWSRLSESNR
jgi:hypothetical protein